MLVYTGQRGLQDALSFIAKTQANPEQVDHCMKN